MSDEFDSQLTKDRVKTRWVATAIVALAIIENPKQEIPILFDSFFDQVWNDSKEHYIAVKIARRLSAHAQLIKENKTLREREKKLVECVEHYARWSRDYYMARKCLAEINAETKEGDDG